MPKWAREYRQTSSAPLTTEGRIRGMVILRVMVKSPVPEMRADSSRVGSIRSRAPLTWMKTKGKRYMVSMRTIPQKSDLLSVPSVLNFDFLYYSLHLPLHFSYRRTGSHGSNAYGYDTLFPEVPDAYA